MNKSGFDSEYANLMAELGENGRGGNGGEPGRTSWTGPTSGHDITAGGSNIPPWRRPEVWQTNPNPQQQQGGYRPPQQGYGSGYGGPAAYGAQSYSTQGGYPQVPGYSQPQSQDYNYAQYYQGQYAQQQQIAATSI